MAGIPGSLHCPWYDITVITTTCTCTCTSLHVLSLFLIKRVWLYVVIPSSSLSSVASAPYLCLISTLILFDKYISLNRISLRI